MKAIKSDLVKRVQQAGIKIPRKEGAKFEFEGREYVVKHVPTKTSL